jgi:hypothetical protein
MRGYAVAPIHTGGVAMRHVGPRDATLVPLSLSMGLFPGCLTLAPSVLRCRDSGSEVAGAMHRALRGISASMPLSRRTPDGVHRLAGARQRRGRPVVSALDGPTAEC